MKAADPVDALMALVRARTGLTLSTLPRSELEASAEAARLAAGAPSLPALVEQLETQDEVPPEIVRVLVTHETYFLRHPDQFALVRNRILPSLPVRAGDRRLKIVSAGCSTGEEPYSLAILLAEEGLDDRCDVVGVDLSPAAIERARAGRYRRWSLRDCDDAFVKRYFEKHQDEYQLRSAVRQKVRFRTLNLADPRDPGWLSVRHADLILCRNVLIYFDAATIALVGDRLIDALDPGGWLVVGPSDPLLELGGKAEQVTGAHGLAYRRLFPGEVSAAHLSGRSAVPASRPRAAPRPMKRTPRPTPSFVPEPRVEPLVRSTPGGPGESEWLSRVQHAADATGPQAADALCDAALVGRPLSVALNWAKVGLKVARGDLDGAIAAVERVLYLDRRLAFAHLTLSSLLRRSGRLAEARKAGRRAYELLDALPPDHLVELSGGDRADVLRERAATRLRGMGEEVPR